MLRETRCEQLTTTRQLDWTQEQSEVSDLTKVGYSL